MNRILLAFAAASAATLLGGCVMGRCCPRTASEARPASTPAPTPAPARASAWYRGEDGAATDLESALAEWREADIVAFGELHGHPVGAAAELALLQGMHAQGAPVALAMEFLERDTQAAVDAYLAGTLDEAAFMKQARQGPAYKHTHGPLLAFCKANQIPVIAANAPRRLVSAYRKQAEDYEVWRESLPEADRAWLPEDTSIIEDEYQERFVRLMGGARGATFFRSQSLWDDAMAEAMYDFRAEHPKHRILFVVGAFHIRDGLGTVTKYKLRRGKDDVRVLVMAMDKDPSLPFRDEDLGAGDVVLKVPTPKRPKAQGPNPHKKQPAATPNPHKKPKAGGVS